jgi:hypothetical protein
MSILAFDEFRRLAEPRSPSTVENRTNTGVRFPASANSDARVRRRCDA